MPITPTCAAPPSPPYPRVPYSFLPCSLTHALLPPVPPHLRPLLQAPLPLKQGIPVLGRSPQCSLCLGPLCLCLGELLQALLQLPHEGRIPA